jgi:Fur family ferric uptake transcriptional regulator
LSDLQALEVSVPPVDKFAEYLGTRGQRLTPERAAIVEEVFSDHEHFDADQLIERLAQRDRGRRVSRSTVYRALDAMVEAGLLRKVARPNDRDVYEHDYGYPQHDHFICEKCKSLTEFRSEAIFEILDRIAAQHGFRLTGHRLEAYGLCEACARPPQRRQRLPGTV